MSTTVNFSSTIEELVEQEVQKRIDETQKELKHTKKQLIEANNRVMTMTREQEQLKDIASRVVYIDKLINVVNVDNISDFFVMLGFKRNDYEKGKDLFSHRHRKWFEVFCDFYEHKDEVLNLFDFFNIKYEPWVRGFKMPYEYNLDQCLMVIKNWSKLSFSSSNNMSNFHECVIENQGNLKKMVSGSGLRTAIAPELFFLNPHLRKEVCFEEIIKILKSKKSNNGTEYFYSLYRYQELAPEQISEMMSCIGELKYISHIQKMFIKKFAKQALEFKPQCAREFERSMDESTEPKNNWSHFTNFPLSMQMKYFENHYKVEDRLRILSQMEMDQDQKLEMVKKYNLL